MKKFVGMLSLLLCAAVLFTACKVDAPANPTLCAESTSSNLPVESTSSTPPSPSGSIAPTKPIAPTLPEYEPGSIRLTNQDSDDYDFNRPYRAVYYTIYGEFFDLVDDTQQQDLHDWLEKSSAETNYGENQNEMLLVSMIKRYNIPREEFEKAVNQYISNQKISSTFMLHEDREVPNPAIIYTFDNELINYYYRYE